MNFNDILKAVQEQKENGAKTMHNQTEIMAGSVGQLAKHEMKPFKTTVCIFPKEIQTPFNPVDPTDTAFNSVHKFVVKGSPTAFVKALKTEMQANADLHEYYAKLAGKTTEEYDISNAEVITEDDFKLFNKFTVPSHFSAETQKIKTAEAGTYGMERLSPLEKDEDGALTNADQYLFGRLFLLEREIRNEKVAEYLSKNKKDSLTSDQKDQLKAIRSSAQISYPKKSGIAVFLELEGTVDKETEEIVLNPIKSGANLDEYLRYYNCNTDELKKLCKKIGKKKIDKYLDYIILKIEYGDGNDPKTTMELALYNSREYSGIEFGSSEDPHKLYDTDEEFDNIITTYFDEGLTGKFEKMIKRNVFKFRPISDNDLRELYVSRLGEIMPFVTAATLTEFGDVIESVSPVVKQKLDKMAENNQLRVSAKQLITSNDVLQEVGTTIDKLDELDTLDSEDDVIDQEVEGGEDLKNILNN